ncbi:hypothetical protein [Desulfosudis oleivorans]|uniref:Uncharacterized protein n=1 Tax=Desulfosudis oleivorans (strain DSM 6200 / JCM 39069 / Hxd3) TaxID=96561 RepID=A8ZWA0_DESOH|nr:hypothetical protein [Desulfosudis oleivorans]ABW68334.1 hypothetical protein Dole_2530 [Desulfosudis oleivorans Hxd3]
MPPSLAESLFITIGNGFSPEVHLIVTKIQGLLWSTADIVLIWFLLKIVGLARADQARAGAVWRYRLLVLSAVLVPFLIVMPTSRAFFVLESGIFGLQFGVLIYTLATDTRSLLDFLRAIITRART